MFETDEWLGTRDMSTKLSDPQADSAATCKREKKKKIQESTIENIKEMAS